VPSNGWAPQFQKHRVLGLSNSAPAPLWRSSLGLSIPQL
jgi:hypothetical protein